MEEEHRIIIKDKKEIWEYKHFRDLEETFEDRVYEKAKELKGKWLITLWVFSFIAFIEAIWLLVMYWNKAVGG